MKYFLTTGINKPIFNYQMGKRVRISDIARQAGVSPATVSRVLNAPHLVADAKRTQIQAAIRELNYVPQAHHRDPRLASGILGFFAPNLRLDSAIELLRCVEAELAETSMDVLVVNMRGVRDFHSFVLQNNHILKKIDGAIVFSADVGADAAHYMRSVGVPVVLMQARSSSVFSVSNNNFSGAQDATRYLIECGYTAIGFVGWDPHDEHVQDRRSGFRSVMEQHDYVARIAGEERGTLDAAGGYAAATKLLASGRPDAVFFASDMMALGGLRSIRDHGLRVPEDIGVMGFDDLAIAAAVGLTTMHQFFGTKARTIVEYLLSRLEEAGDREPDERGGHADLQIAPRLVVRDTTSVRNSDADHALVSTMLGPNAAERGEI